MMRSNPPIFKQFFLEKLKSIATYLSNHPKRSTALVSLQFKQYSRDRVSKLDKPFHTRWHSKLTTLEKFIVMQPLLSTVLPSDAPLLPEKSDENSIAICIDVLREVRRVEGALEADRNVSASRVPQLMKELRDTLDIMSLTRGRRS